MESGQKERTRTKESQVTEHVVIYRHLIYLLILRLLTCYRLILNLVTSHTTLKSLSSVCHSQENRLLQTRLLGNQSVFFKTSLVTQYLFSWKYISRCTGVIEKRVRKNFSTFGPKLDPYTGGSVKGRTFVDLYRYLCSRPVTLHCFHCPC